MRLIHYKPRCLLPFQKLPGIEKFLYFFRVYSLSVMPVDRTGALRFPVRTKSLFPLPKLIDFTKTYAEICDARAQELLQRADTLDVPLYMFWSGGIDSTCILVSLLKNATIAQKERITVLMSEDSITEYPDFYRNHIRGKLHRESATMFPYLLGERALLVTGEHNDQLFGSDMVASIVKNYGFDAINQPFDCKLFIDFFINRHDSLTEEAASFLFEIIERLRSAAPITLHTNYDVFWWINFALKWQNVYVRMLSYAKKAPSKQYIQDYYVPFYSSDDFQLWSMTTPYRRVEGNWRHYKWTAKEIIYDFTKDTDYRDNKIKRGSLIFLFDRHIPVNFIDDKWKFRDVVSPDDFYEGENDFV